MTDLQRLTLEASLQEFQKRTRASPELRRQVAAGLAEESPVLFYRLTDQHYDAEYVRQITDRVRQAVRASGLYPKDPAPTLQPHVFLLGESRVVGIDQDGPAVPVSAEEEKGELRVTIWVCPDRGTALDLFWLRSGGRLPDPKTVPERLHRDSRAALLPHKDAPGERAYQYLPQEVLNVALKKGDPRTLGNRVGFLRHNLVVELHRLTYYRTKTDPTWLTGGLLPGDIKDLLALGTALDRALRQGQGTPKSK